MYVTSNAEHFDLPWDFFRATSCSNKLFHYNPSCMWDFCAAERGNFGHPFADIDPTPGWLMEVSLKMRRCSPAKKLMMNPWIWNSS